MRLTEEDVDAHERDGGLLGCNIGRAGYRSSDRHDKLADTHADGSHKQQVSAAHLLNEIETWKCGCHVDAAIINQPVFVRSIGVLSTHFVITEMTNGSWKPAFSKYWVP